MGYIVGQPCEDVGQQIEKSEREASEDSEKNPEAAISDFLP